jgi:hypothetical protein
MTSDPCARIVTNTDQACRIVADGNGPTDQPPTALFLVRADLARRSGRPRQHSNLHTRLRRAVRKRPALVR